MLKEDVRKALVELFGEVEDEELVEKLLNRGTEIARIEEDEHRWATFYTAIVSFRGKLFGVPNFWTHLENWQSGEDVGFSRELEDVCFAREIQVTTTSYELYREEEQ